MGKFMVRYFHKRRYNMAQHRLTQHIVWSDLKISKIFNRKWLKKVKGFVIHFFHFQKQICNIQLNQKTNTSKENCLSLLLCMKKGFEVDLHFLRNSIQ